MMVLDLLWSIKMQKMTFLLAVLLVGMAAHGKTITKKDMVGTWQCSAYERLNDGQSAKSTTLDTINKDGSMSQVWEIIYYDNKDRFSGLEYFTIKNRWDFRKNEMKIYDWQLQNYQSYDSYKLPVDEETNQMLKQDWQAAYAESYTQKITFVNHNEFLYGAEDDVQNTSACYRKS